MGVEEGRHNTKNLNRLGFSVLAIFPGKYSYSLYWMINEHLKTNWFQTKPGNEGLQMKMLCFLEDLNFEFWGRSPRRLFSKLGPINSLPGYWSLWCSLDTFIWKCSLSTSDSLHAIYPEHKILIFLDFFNASCMISLIMEMNPDISKSCGLLCSIVDSGIQEAAWKVH